jgi:hypothetical protein
VDDRTQARLAELVAAPGHIPLADAGSELVQFSPRDELREVGAAMEANMRKMMQGA